MTLVHKTQCYTVVMSQTENNHLYEEIVGDLGQHK